LREKQRASMNDVSKHNARDMYTIKEEDPHEILAQSYGHNPKNPNAWTKQI
jgi:hypothetical protein